MGVLTSLSLDAIYLIYYFTCIISFCFLMTINTFELKIELNIMIKNVSFVFVSDTPIRPTQIGLDMK